MLELLNEPTPDVQSHKTRISLIYAFKYAPINLHVKYTVVGQWRIALVMPKTVKNEHFKV